MASALAHELNQPLTAISNFASGAARRVRAGEMSVMNLERVLCEIDGLARRGGSLIHRVREQARGREPNKGRVDPREAIAQAWRSLQHDAERAGAVVQFDFDSAPSSVPVDPVQFEQVILNLMRNAIEELAECPSEDRFLHVRAMTHTNLLIVEVKDRGRGLSIDAEDLFQPFKSGKDWGMGLGLSISRSIIESYGGRIRWTPATPRGSCFRVELPLDSRTLGDGS